MRSVNEEDLIRSFGFISQLLNSVRGDENGVIIERVDHEFTLNIYIDAVDAIHFVYIYSERNKIR